MSKYCPHCGGNKFGSHSIIIEDRTVSREINCFGCDNTVACFYEFLRVDFDNRVDIDMAECKEVVDRRAE